MDYKLLQNIVTNNYIDSNNRMIQKSITRIIYSVKKSVKEKSIDSNIPSIPFEINSISDLKSLIGLTFFSKPIYISNQNLKDFCELTGDINPIHLTVENAKESILFDMVGDNLTVSSYYLMCLFANEKVLYNAIEINEKHEIINIETMVTKFFKPLPAEHNVVYRVHIKSAKEIMIKGRECIKLGFENTFYYHNRKINKLIPCGKGGWYAAYIPLK